MAAERPGRGDSEPGGRSQGENVLAILLDVSKSLASSLQLEEVLQAATDGVTHLHELKTAAVYLGEGDTLRLWATTPPLPPGFPDELRLIPLADHPHLQGSLTSGAPLFLPDTAAAELTAAEAAVTSLRGLRSVLYLPLIANVKRMGALIVASVGHPVTMSDEEIDSCRTLANLAALAVQNAQLYALERQHAADLERRVTEHERAEKALRESEERLLHAQKLESVGRLAGGVAHDFNNVLLVVLACTELVKLRHGGDPDLLARMEEIERAALRARDITRQLLAVSRKQTAAPRALELRGFLAETRKTLGRLIGEDIGFELHLGADLWPVHIDPSQLDQVLMNLVVNARDAMPRGGKLSIEATNVHLDESYCREHAGFRAGDYVLLAVSDSGVGMDRETLAHLFEPFFTTKAVGKGTGLGLATVHGIVSQNGGAVGVYSEPGVGTTFRIYLPRLRQAPASASRPAETPAPRRGGTILMVEDDDAVRRTLAAMLDALGFSVLATSGWREALAVVERKEVEIELLLTDVVMPELSGKELSDRLRAVRPGLRVLYMSGHAANVLAHHGILPEGVHFIQKPFGMDDLGRAVRAAFGP